MAGDVTVFRPLTGMHPGFKPLAGLQHTAPAGPRGRPGRGGRHVRDDGLLRPQPGLRSGHRGQADQLRGLARLGAANLHNKDTARFNAVPKLNQALARASE